VDSTLLLLAHLGMVADFDSLDQEQDVFGNVGGMVGKPLQGARNEHQVDALTDAGGILLHQGNQLFVY